MLGSVLHRGASMCSHAIWAACARLYHPVPAHCSTLRGLHHSPVCMDPNQGESLTTTTDLSVGSIQLWVDAYVCLVHDMLVGACVCVSHACVCVIVVIARILCHISQSHHICIHCSFMAPNPKLLNPNPKPNYLPLKRVYELRV